MRKVVLSFLSLLICVGSVYSQFDAQLSQYMFHNSSFNPAAVGEDDMIQVTGQLRSQWLGIPNAGQTLIFSINSPFKIQNSKHGIGIRFIDDKVGLFTNQTLHLQYAYKKKLNDGVLSVGTDLGYTSLGFNGDSVSEISIGEYHNISGDPEIPQSSVVGMSFDMNLGVFYSTPSYYVGLSYLHLNNPTVNWGDFSEFKLYSSLFFTGAYNWALPDSKLVLKPSTLIKTDFSSLQFDLTGRVEYDNKYWGGLSYRLQDAVVFLAGINISSGVTIGCSYDLPTSRILSVSPGSLEVLFLYNFEYVFAKRTNKYKSIRIL
ncbi:MAG: PorP/SprF family type IX secretion system membrane protein [Paludibacter sp.]|nr:PorP/SprF family type IX secretion system membrane protein [Paludibacter sp.]